MKKKNSLLFILLMYSLTMLAQKDITKFMGIPVDGFKKDIALGNIRNTVCSCPDLWLHPPKDNT